MSRESGGGQRKGDVIPFPGSIASSAPERTKVPSEPDSSLSLIQDLAAARLSQTEMCGYFEPDLRALVKEVEYYKSNRPDLHNVKEYTDLVYHLIHLSDIYSTAQTLERDEMFDDHFDSVEALTSRIIEPLRVIDTDISQCSHPIPLHVLNDLLSSLNTALFDIRFSLIPTKQRNTEYSLRVIGAVNTRIRGITDLLRSERKKVVTVVGAVVSDNSIKVARSGHVHFPDAEFGAQRRKLQESVQGRWFGDLFKRSSVVGGTDYFSEEDLLPLVESLKLVESIGLSDNAESQSMSEQATTIRNTILRLHDDMDAPDDDSEDAARRGSKHPIRSVLLRAARLLALKQGIDSQQLRLAIKEGLGLVSKCSIFLNRDTIKLVHSNEGTA